MPRPSEILLASQPCLNARRLKGDADAVRRIKWRRDSNHGNQVGTYHSVWTIALHRVEAHADHACLCRHLRRRSSGHSSMIPHSISRTAHLGSILYDDVQPRRACTGQPLRYLYGATQPDDPHMSSPCLPECRRSELRNTSKGCLLEHYLLPLLCRLHPNTPVCWRMTRCQKVES
jgi:hypothetical protein